MNTNLTIKNFRVFDNNGVKIEISPLTFLVGCNSSGKSSIIKAISLLKSFFQQKYDAKNPVRGSSIDFSESPNNTLGSFKNVLSDSSSVKEIELSYETHSLYLNDSVKVTITLEEGDLGNAKITKVQIRTLAGKIIVDSNGADNIPYLKNTFKHYLIAIRFRSYVEDILSNNSMLGTTDYYQLKEELLNGTATFFKKDYAEALKYCSSKYLQEVYNSKTLRSLKMDAPMRCAIDKYIETNILTYSSLFDEMKGMETPEEIRAFLKSKIMKSNEENVLSKAVDIICLRYKNSGMKDFLSFYRSMEDEKLELYIPALYNTDDDIIDSFLYGGYQIPLPRDVDVALCSQYIGVHFIRNVMAHLSSDDPYFKIVKNDDYSALDHCSHSLYHEFFIDYTNSFINEVLNVDITESFEYIGSSRIIVRRMYPMEDKTEFSQAVRRYYETKNRFLSLNPPIKVTLEEDGIEQGHTLLADFVPGNFMDKWLKTFNIGHHISMEMDENELGLLLKIYKTASDKKGMLLADMGYGITQFFSIVLQIEEMIMSSLYIKYKQFTPSETDVLLVRPNHRHVSLSDVETPFMPQTIAIEEPEIHLHPKYQALLAEMFYEAYRDYNIQFIIETHSEYLLRKIQTLIGAKKLSPEEVSMIYVEDDVNVNKNVKKVRRIPIKEDGRLAEPFGPGFYDEADNLTLELFTNMGKS